MRLTRSRPGPILTAQEVHDLKEPRSSAPSLASFTNERSEGVKLVQAGIKRCKHNSSFTRMWWGDFVVVNSTWVDALTLAV